MERVSVARMATVKPQGWVDAALGMGGPSPAFPLLNRYAASMNWELLLKNSAPGKPSSPGHCCTRLKL
jgi:hypothetical protein